MNRLANVLLVLVSILFSLVVVELLARVAVRFLPEPAKTWQEFRLTVPEPYKNSKYDVKKIIAEVQHVGNRPDPNFGYIHTDFNGSYINIEKGYRRTTDLPKSPTKTVWIFGGSTVLCSEVPDNLTMPSFFSRFANSKYRNTLNVVNVGTTTVTIHHQLYRLKNSIDLKSGDIVIFLDGVNDVIQTLAYKDPKGNMVAHNREQMASGGLLLRANVIIFDRFGNHSVFIRRFLNPFKESKLSGIKYSENMLNGLEDDYFKQIRLANEYVNSKKATFYHFLQPNLFTVSHHTSYEENLLNNPYLVPEDLNDAYKQGYPKLRAATARAAKLGINAYDISNAFDRRTSEIFLDFCHVNETGNSLLAKAILEQIGNKIL